MILYFNPVYNTRLWFSDSTWWQYRTMILYFTHDEIERQWFSLLIIKCKGIHNTIASTVMACRVYCTNVTYITLSKCIILLYRSYIVCDMYYCDMCYTILIALNYRSLYYLSCTVLYDMYFTICHVVYYLSCTVLSDMYCTI